MHSLTHLGYAGKMNQKEKNLNANSSGHVPFQNDFLLTAKWRPD